jgi:hypothetical protein
MEGEEFPYFDVPSPVGYSVLFDKKLGEYVTHVEFDNGERTALRDLSAQDVERYMLQIPPLEQHQRANMLSMTVLAEITAKLKILNFVFEERDKLREHVTQHALDIKRPLASDALREENIKLQKRVLTVNNHTVAALSATVIRLQALCQKFAPLGKALSQHTDNRVRQAYFFHCSLLNVADHLCEMAIDYCDRLMQK